MDTRQQASKLVAQMTLSEKASFCSGENFWCLKGVERLKLPSIMTSDGPHGLRKQLNDADNLGLGTSVPATCFPSASLTACSFDRALLKEIGRALGEECRQENVAVVLGPGVNMKRSPLCGRNFEYFSEDPLLAGELAAAFIQGVQSQSVGTSLKHFAANNQEKLRMTTESVVDERTLREIYFPAFEIAVKKAQPWTVMCSYNRIRGEYAGDSKWLLTDVLRHEWGYDGMVVSDWGATNDRVQGVRAGLDLEMPAVTRDSDRAVENAVQSGALDMADLDTDAARVTELILKSAARQPFTYDQTAHRALARRAAAASAVLLKNENAILPLAPGASLAVIGEMAAHPRYQGAGSSLINPHFVDNALDALTDAGFAYDYAEGYDLSCDEADDARIEKACDAARGKDAVIVFAGLPDRYESEGFDRTTLSMPEAHVRLIERVSAVNPRTVVVLQTGGVVECPWAPAVAAILLQYLGGEASARATVDVLTGAVNPSGKLAESWCNTLSDNPSYPWFPGYPHSVEYRESVFIGYRYYDTAGKDVRWPFGYGSSYTTFAYGDLAVDKTDMTDAETLTVSCSVANTGARAGSEIVELYVSPKVDGIFRPVQELKGFEKIALDVGEIKHVSFTLDRRAFAYYNVEIHDWAVESGEYEIRIAASSRDIRLRTSVTVTAEHPVPAPDVRKIAPCYYDLSHGLDVSDEAFTALLGRPLPARSMQKGDLFTVNSTVIEMQQHWFGRILWRVVKRIAAKMIHSDPESDRMMLAMLHDAPLRMLIMSGAGVMTQRRLDGIVDVLNGHTLRGFAAILRG